LCAKAEQAEAKRATCLKNLGKPLATSLRILALLNDALTTLTVGDTAPDFSAIAVGAEFAEDKPFRLSDYFAEQIVLYF
jgi:hypothetical protein